MGKQISKRSWEAAKLRSLLTVVVGLFNPMLEKVARVPTARFLGMILNKSQEKKKGQNCLAGKGNRRRQNSENVLKILERSKLFCF